ncbi:hypothetical protein LLH06_05425 [Mucilaginibacter daejeonensis]|uniref:hypothetical protein n=1 Tax=Mucilaginibacter daejeonensis TaxID=398049 RepID=UPI001D170C13|nr:hypothetical protein [Mucilaginibacter daejeonensis]UEG54405.1 hypothetical protein LLH06_05425 [Mucilaginibacter daejeonensis]
MTEIREYGNYTGPDNYRDEKELTLQQGTFAEASIPYSVTNNASVLTMGYLCPPNALCGQSYLVFNKVR